MMNVKNLTKKEKEFVEMIKKEKASDITTDEIVILDSIIEKLDPEVARELISQLPAGIKGMTECVKIYSDTANKMIEANDSSNQSYFGLEKEIVDTAREQISKDDTPFEEKKYWQEEMEKCAERVGKKDTENKKFLLIIGAMGSTLCMGALAVIGAVFLGKVNIKIPKP